MRLRAILQPSAARHISPRHKTQALKTQESPQGCASVTGGFALLAGLMREELYFFGLLILYVSLMLSCLHTLLALQNPGAGHLQELLDSACFRLFERDCASSEDQCGYAVVRYNGREWRCHPFTSMDYSQSTEGCISDCVAVFFCPGKLADEGDGTLSSKIDFIVLEGEETDCTLSVSLIRD
ncbi:putative microneme protein [Cyclospora cayetanensis]|uniref:Microneme protein n=1 Tax=Cyclospora cayetanensis TaxID=88456 RepID=A0A1D3D772_9EIME|nr:putative microneme protein [Cyclospora cayetanensis]